MCGICSFHRYKQLIEFEIHSPRFALQACILHEGNEAQRNSGKQGRSIKIGSHKFSEFVQVQTVFFKYQRFFS